MDKIIEKEFESKPKMPLEMKRDTVREILQNLLMVAIVLVLLSLICFMDERLIKETFSFGLKILSTFFAIISVIFFEIAYRKEKLNSFFWAVEFLILGLIIMFVPYLSQYIQKFIFGIAIIFGIYYLVKFILIILKKKNELSNLRSDVREIIKPEKTDDFDDM